MSGNERSLARNQRIVLSAVIWLVVGPLIVGFFYLAWPLGILLLVLASWTTWDYIRKGGMADHVARGLSQEGRVADGAVEHYGHEEKD